MIGSILNWLQEHTSPVFCWATCNNYEALPPELTRMGRFDERWFLDLPSGAERRQIAHVHLARLGCLNNNVEETAELCAQVAQLTADWSGAEIATLIKNAARITRRAVDAATLESESQMMKPLSETSADKVRKLQEWAQSNLRLANG